MIFYLTISIIIATSQFMAIISPITRFFERISKLIVLLEAISFFSRPIMLLFLISSYNCLD